MGIVENIGVMAMTRVYSTLIFIIAAIVAILLGLCPKFGALIEIIPGQAQGILTGLSIVLFGLIAATGGRIWVENRVDFGKSRNLLTAGIGLILATGGYVLHFGNFDLVAIPLATFTTIILYQVLRDPREQSGQPAGAAAEASSSSAKSGSSASD